LIEFNNQWTNKITGKEVDDNELLSFTLLDMQNFAKKYAEAITFTRCCESDSEQLLFTQEEIVARINEQTVLDGETFRNYFDKK